MLKRNWPSTENVPVDILYEIGELQEKEQLENIKFFEDNEQKISMMIKNLDSEQSKNNNRTKNYTQK